MNTGTYIITSKVGTRKLHACTSGTASNGLNVIIKTTNDSPDQMWYFNGSRLKSGSNRKFCLTRDSSSTYKNNANIYESQTSQNTNQVINIVETTDGYYNIVLRNSIDGETLYLTVVNNADGTNSGKSTSSYGNVYWTTAKGSNNQKWSFTKISEPSNATTINGVKVPLAEFPDDGNTYWTLDGTGSGNSKDFNGIECAGFARYIYYCIWGSDTYGSAVGTDASDDIQVNTNGTCFNNIPVGSRITCVRRDGEDTHSMVIIKKTASNITVYEANHTNLTSTKHCIVGTRTISFSSFYNEYTYIRHKSYTPT